MLNEVFPISPQFVFYVIYVWVFFFLHLANKFDVRAGLKIIRYFSKHNIINEGKIIWNQNCLESLNNKFIKR